MSERSRRRESGFSLLEMTIAMALGMIVLGAAVSIYSQGVAATWTVTQRAEMQQDFRAASNMLTRDLSLAGAGLGNAAAIELPTSATIPVYGCDQSACYIAGGAVNYPLQSGTTPYLYGLLPGYNLGPTINSMATDVVTIVYTDSTFTDLTCYVATRTNSTTVTFTTTPASLTNCGNPTPQAVNNAASGLTTGDLVLFSFSPNVVAEVTSISGNVATFSTGDPLKMNQTSATYSLASSPAGSVGTGTRLLVITYYIDNTVSPPRLMRQISGHTPMAVADNVVYLKFSYDLYNDANSALAVNQPNPGSGDGSDTASNGLLPNQITKINVLHMAMNSELKGAKGGYQGLDLSTSVSARDLTYSNQYPQH